MLSLQSHYRIVTQYTCMQNMREFKKIRVWFDEIYNKYIIYFILIIAR